MFLSILLISNKDYDYVWLALGHYFLEPVLEVEECVYASDVVGKDHTVGASVEDLGNRLEGLLSGRVPNLQLEHLLF